MIIRCRSCHGTLWVQPAAEWTCRGCGQRYDLDSASERRLRSRRSSARARRIAASSGIDLPGAYSVLLGIMTVDEVRELERARAAGGAQPATRKERDSPRKLAFDPAFRPAVEAGFLTPRQAMERGSRETYAQRLRLRHQISSQLAQAVADNRLPLMEALRKRDAAKRDPLPVGVPAGPPARTVGLVAALLLVALAAGLFRGTVQKRSTVEHVEELGRAELRTDGQGRVVQLLGPDPKTVLRSYCASGEDGPFEALGVVPSSLPGARARLGLLRDSTDPQKLLAITIREDRDSGRWVAGDGQAPLTAKPAPAGAEKAARGS